MNGVFSAQTIEAMAPLIRQAYDNERADDRIGFFAFPHPDGAVALCVTGFAWVAILDRAAKFTAPCKINIPLQLLTIATAKKIMLEDENGESVEAPMEPRPTQVIFAEACAIISCEDNEKWGGCLGSFGRADENSNILDLTKYYIGPIPERFQQFYSLLGRFRALPVTIKPSKTMLWFALQPLAHLSNVFKTTFKLTFRGSVDDPVEFANENGDVWGFAMPAKASETTSCTDLGAFLLQQGELTKAASK